MQRIVLCISLLLISMHSAYSQISFGIKSGGNISNVAYKSSENIYRNKIRVYAGALLQSGINEKLFGRAELLYSLKGNNINLKNNYYARKGIDEFHYLNLPVLLGYRLIKKVAVFFGPEIGYLVYARQNFNDNPKNITAACNKFDIAADLGIGYKITSSIELEARYSYGFRNVLSYTDYDSNGNILVKVNDGTNRVFQTGIVYYLNR